jgi:hypothetical protein
MFRQTLASQVSTTSKPKWRLSQLENFYCSARRPAGFNSGFNSHSHSHLNDSPGLSCSPFHLHPATPPRGDTNPVESGQGGSEPRLRRSSAGDTNFSRKPGRSSSSHIQGPTEPRLDHQVPETRSDQSCATSHPARCRNRANRPCIYRAEINVVLSLKSLYLSPFRAPIWTPDLCFVAGPTFWVFWVVIILIYQNHPSFHHTYIWAEDTSDLKRTTKEKNICLNIAELDCID